MEKTLDNASIADVKEKVTDVKVTGDGDLFKLMSKASSAREGWMKSTKVMPIEGAGCLVQVTTQQYNHVAEALCFVPGVVLSQDRDGNLCLKKEGRFP